jgi:hypothetical protein
MESAGMNDPKDEHILNKDDSITNKDGDNYLERGELPTDHSKSDQKRASTVTPNDNTGEPEPPAEDKPAKKDAETRKYAL